MLIAMTTIREKEINGTLVRIVAYPESVLQMDLMYVVAYYNGNIVNHSKTYVYTDGEMKKAMATFYRYCKLAKMRGKTRYDLLKESERIEPDATEKEIYNAKVSKAYTIRKIDQSPVLSNLRDLLINARVGTVLTYDTGNSFEIYEKVIDHTTEYWVLVTYRDNSIITGGGYDNGYFKSDSKRFVERINFRNFGDKKGMTANLEKAYLNDFPEDHFDDFKRVRVNRHPWICTK